MGCDTVLAMVTDDNAASWKSLQNHGVSTPPLWKMVRLLGFGRAALAWLRTALCFATGARFWMTGPLKRRGTLWELTSFLWVNLLLLFGPDPLRWPGTRFFTGALRWRPACRCTT